MVKPFALKLFCVPLQNRYEKISAPYLQPAVWPVVP